MKLKRGVQFANAKPQVWFAIGMADQIFKRFSFVNVVTSICDSDPKRVDGSLHAMGLACDLRARMNAAGRQALLGVLTAELNPLGYDVLLHGSGSSLHFHIEYDPKGQENWQETVA